VTLPATPTQTDPGKRPEPVLGAAGAASALTSVVGVVLLVLVFAHVITPDGQAVLGPALASAIPTVVGAVATLVAALRARGQVTPLSAPVSAAGVALVEAGESIAAAVREVSRPAGPQVPGVPDHALPEG
jgi:hypothetical protein